MNNDTKERKSLFSDINVEKDMNNAKLELFKPYKEKENLSKEVINAVEGLEDLLNATKRAHFSVKGCNDPQHIKNVKEELDKIAFLIEKFVNDFEPIYRENYSIYTMEKIAGSYDKNNSTVGIDHASVSSISGISVISNSIPIKSNQMFYFENNNNEYEDTHKQKGWKKKS